MTLPIYTLLHNLDLTYNYFNILLIKEKIHSINIFKNLKAIRPITIALSPNKNV